MGHKFRMDFVEMNAVANTTKITVPWLNLPSAT
jgi:hypothetical protein